jgi:hypothetical protein
MSGDKRSRGTDRDAKSALQRSALADSHYVLKVLGDALHAQGELLTAATKATYLYHDYRANARAKNVDGRRCRIGYMESQHTHPCKNRKDAEPSKSYGVLSPALGCATRLEAPMRTLALVLAAVVLSPRCLAQTSTKPTPTAAATSKAKNPETSHLVFVTEYIRELSAIENIRASGEEELKQDPNAAFSDAIHSSTLFQLELRSQIHMLKRMHLNAPYADLIPNITAFYEDKIALWQRMIDISSAFIGGPKCIAPL